ncbi:MAG: immunoglobulin-like domain-containing protein, partial [Clostridia bacterium]|nr:immunoglobulin-like domain-containing protein [Clostridia bacterium]
MLGISAPAMAVSAWTSELTSEFMVYDNFDGYSGGIATHTIEGAAWSKSGDGVPVEGGKVTVSSATKATNTMVDLNTAITSDYAVIDFDFNITTANENNTALFYIKDSSNKDITRIQAQYKNGAMYLYTYKGGTESDKTTKVTLIASIDTSATYNLSVLYDFTNKTIDYYVNNELKYEDGGCYPNEITDIDKLFIQANYDNSTTTTIDISNVKIGVLTDKLAMHYDSYYTAPTADDWSNLTSLTLPTTTKYGSAITWTSSDTKVIANEGTIDTLNALVTGSDVTLTGTYSKNGGTYTCTYDATVY